MRTSGLSYDEDIMARVTERTGFKTPMPFPSGYQPLYSAETPNPIPAPTTTQDREVIKYHTERQMDL